MRLEISSTLLARLLADAAASPQAEICGLLFGSDRMIEAAETCANVASEPARRFEIDPVALFAAHRRARGGGAAVIGCYHSHPSGDPVPSVIDAESAMGDGAVWIILGGGEALAWRSGERGVFEPVELVVV
ncbi:M67 family metallopeptidase [Sphingomonas aliaeris]|uniref:M67 family metallopeptidase n=1 Tax=Sphingomonas aliaeris TaxID=2759526 RepID=A0A974S3J2_9SPHN|nr:M67 family metallopeptidase [Sphingomonas aliaeris]QQV76105.1 M67 family metallopeptidase [Sphingomonas aliaeris]